MKNFKLIALATVAVSMFMTSCKEAPKADFEVQEGTLYTTKDIKFTDESDGGGIDAQWTFKDAVVESSTSSNPTAVWNTPGTYDVTLVATNKKGTDQITKQVTIEEYIPFITIENNTPGNVWVCIGINGLQDGESEANWVIWDKDHNKGSLIVEPGTTVDVKLWGDDDDAVDISGKDELYVAMFSGQYLYSKDAEGGKQPLVWHNEGLSKFKMDSKAIIDVNENFFFATIDNQGYSVLTNVIAYMGETINDDVIGTAKKTIKVDEKKGIGYFDAREGLKLGTILNNSQALTWSNFDSKYGVNCEIVFQNTEYKSTGLKTEVVATKGTKGIINEGDIVLNNPRASNIDVDKFELFKKSVK